MFARICSLFAALFVFSHATIAADQNWIQLFDGKSLDGWKRHGGKAEYRAENGEIVGTSVAGQPNSFLCTEQQFTNFVLELEFKVASGLNSGVMIRSHVFDKPTEFTWKEKTTRVPANRVHGMQVEIDPGDRAWSGGLYEEGARGWLNDLKANDAARKAFKREEWNQFRIEAKGDHYKTFINGVPAGDLHDARVASGFIGLQVHGVGRNAMPKEVRFRNIRLKPL